MISGNKIALLTLCTVLFMAGSATAKPGDITKGKDIYDKRCTWCHGPDGDGAGAAQDRLNPPPRDFTYGSYKIKTSSFDSLAPNDDDVFRMIRDGMPGTAMPGWNDLLTEQDMWDLVAYVKFFARFGQQAVKQIDFGSQIPSSAESIEKGKQLFEMGDRCVECHGKSGKGSATKRLMGDLGERTWARNLTKPWTFRGSNDPKDIFARITTGIAGTVMPSFANPRSKKSLSIEDRWHVANYVASLAKTDKKVNADNTVIKAEAVDGELPNSPDDERWKETAPTTFYLVPQIIGEERFFKPSNDTITVRAIYNDKTVAMLIEWDDRTKSIPGDDRAERIGDLPLMEDGVAVQLPVIIPKEMEKPYFGMGDAAHPVNIWHWKSGTTDSAESISMLNSKGYKDIEKRDANEVGLQARSSYIDGTWRVLMYRPLTTPTPEKDIQFTDGRFIPVAFAAWDGSNNSEKGSKHTMTTWYWLLLKPATGFKPIITALMVMGLLAGGLLWWARSSKKTIA
jgi:DMSO reductase family type II enzyme heme b subunit